MRSRALTEEHARDSFENLLFSVCRFRELTGSYPHNITVKTFFTFKCLTLYPYCDVNVYPSCFGGSGSEL